MEEKKLYLSQKEVLEDFCVYSRSLFADFIQRQGLATHTDIPNEKRDELSTVYDLKTKLGTIYANIVHSLELGLSSPILSLFSNLQLTEFEEFMLIYLLSLEVDLDFGDLQKRAFPQGLSKQALARLYCKGHGSGMDLFQETHSFSPQGNYVFLYEGDAVRLSPAVLTYALTESFPLAESLDDLEELIIYEPERKRISGAIENHPDEHILIALCATKNGGKKHLAKHVAKSLDKAFFALDFTWLLTLDKEDLQRKKEEIFLFAALVRGVFYLSLANKALEGRELALFQELLKLIQNCEGICILGARDSAYLDCHHFTHYLYVPLAPLTAREKALAWLHFAKDYPIKEEIHAQDLGNKYVLNLGDIKKAYESAHLISPGDITKESIEQGIKMRGHSLEGATLLRTDFRFEDLIVEEDVSRQLWHIIEELKYKDTIYHQWGFDKKFPYGRGISALFYGPPGTGKTMTASVIANELGLDLYRVDLSKLVSKYIGETEKNISALFQKAKNMNAVLFFDEADALFSKRTEVKDANDKNANAESAHLLQELENYEGVSILASNLFSQIDDAFRRRIKFMIAFPLPDKETRRRLWLSALPGEEFLDGSVAVDFFAQEFELNGSQIKEVVLHSAFMAVSQGKKLGNEEIIEALKLNYQKYGKRLSKEDFGYLV